MSLEVGTLLPKPDSGQSVEDYGRQCAVIGIFNERAAALQELDALARAFDQAGKPNTARKVRDTMEVIDARLRASTPAPFDGSTASPTSSE